MKTKIMTVTPQFAASLIKRTEGLIKDGKMNQRNISRPTIDQYARAMSLGKWVMHHQGIAIGEHGGVIDGQHRLHAIVQAQTPVDIMVTSDIPTVAYKNGYAVMTIDAVDRGRLRAIGQQLQMSHGIKSGNSIAAICRGIVVACIKDKAIRLTVTDCLAVIDVYRREIETVTSIDPKTWTHNSTITAGLVMGVFAGDKGLRFAQQYLLGDHARNDPANVLKRWWANVGYKQGGGTALLTLSGVAYCIRSEFEGKKLEKGFASSEALQWLVDKQGKNAAKVRSVFQQAALI